MSLRSRISRPSTLARLCATSLFVAAGSVGALGDRADSGAIFMYNGQFSNAITCYQHYRAVPPDSVRMHRAIQDAWLAGSDSLRRQIVASYRILRDSLRRNAAANYLYGRCLPCREGMRYFDSALAIDESCAWARIGRGACFTEENRIDLAKAEFLKAIQSAPGLEEAYGNLAAAYLLENNPARALKVYRKLIGRERRNPRAYEMLGDMYLKRKQHAQARMAYGKALALGARGPSVSFKAGYTSFQQKLFADAVDLYTRSIRAGNARFEVYYNLGSSLEQLRRFDEALDSYKTAFTISNDTGVLFAIGNCAVMLGLYSKAIESYSCFLQKEPRHIEALFGLANAYQLKKEYAAAVDLYRRVLVIEPRFARAYYNLGSIYAYHLPDPEKMAEYWTEFLEISNDNDDKKVIRQELERWNCVRQEGL